MYRVVSGVFNVESILTGQFQNQGKNLPTQSIYLSCDTSLAPVTINLPAISDLQGFLNLKIFINDASENAAANPITVNANVADKINNGASVVINEDGESMVLNLVDFNDWNVTEGGGAGASFSPFDLIVDITEGNDATAQAGSLVNKFQTIAAAIAFAEADLANTYHIHVLAGNYQEDGLMDGTAITELTIEYYAGAFQSSDGNMYLINTAINLSILGYGQFFLTNDQVLINQGFLGSVLTWQFDEVISNGQMIFVGDGDTFIKGRRIEQPIGSASIEMIQLRGTGNSYIDVDEALIQDSPGASSFRVHSRTGEVHWNIRNSFCPQGQGNSVFSILLAPNCDLYINADKIETIGSSGACVHIAAGGAAAGNVVVNVGHMISSGTRGCIDLGIASAVSFTANVGRMVASTGEVFTDATIDYPAKINGVMVQTGNFPVALIRGGTTELTGRLVNLDANAGSVGIDVDVTNAVQLNGVVIITQGALASIDDGGAALAVNVISAGANVAPAGTVVQNGGAVLVNANYF